MSERREGERREEGEVGRWTEGGDGGNERISSSEGERDQKRKSEHVKKRYTFGLDGKRIGDLEPEKQKTKTNQTR